MLRTKILDLKGLSLLMGLCLIMLAQRSITIITWFVLGLVCLYCFLKWRQAILLVFIWLAIEGFLRLWTGGSIIVFFFKDVMLGAIYLSFLMEKLFFREKESFSNVVNLPILCLFLLSLLQMLNPNLLNPLVGLVGLKTLFFYVPLFYLAYKLFDSKDCALQFCFILISIAIPICIYAMIQFLQGPAAYSSLGEKFAPWIVSTEKGTAVFTPPSTFMFISNFGGYQLFMALLGMSMLNINLAHHKKIICWISFTSILCAMVITSRRGAWLMLAIQYPIMYLLQGKIRPFLRLITAPVLIIILSTYLIPGAGELFFGRTAHVFTHPGEVIYSDRIITLLRWHIPILLSTAFIGKGIGMGSIGSRYVLDEFVVREGIESHYAKMWYELSIWGFLIFIWLAVRLVRSAWGIYRELDEPDMKWLALGILMYQWAIIIVAATTNILDMPLSAMYFWFFSGLLFKLPLLAAQKPKPQEGL